MIKIKNLSFAYGKASIFKDFNLEIQDGEVALITGINGVGKSTLLRLLAGVLRPDGGEISFGPDLGSDPRRFIGFISDVPSLYESMTVSQAIEFHKSVYRIEEYDDRLIKRTKIDAGRKISQLSMGQRVIFHLSLILSASPKVLLIDEVIHTIDVYLRGIFLRELIGLLSERSITVVFVNLNFRDIENMVDRVILLKDGDVAVDETIDDLKSKVKKIVGRDLNNNLPVLFQVDYVDYSDYYIYPFSPDAAAGVVGDVVDLDLTAIVNAFIGGEYV